MLPVFSTNAVVIFDICIHFSARKCQTEAGDQRIPIRTLAARRRKGTVVTRRLINWICRWYRDSLDWNKEITEHTISDCVPGLRRHCKSCSVMRQLDGVQQYLYEYWTSTPLRMLDLRSRMDTLGQSSMSCFVVIVVLIDNN